MSCSFYRSHRQQYKLFLSMTTVQLSRRCEWYKNHSALGIVVLSKNPGSYQNHIDSKFLFEKYRPECDFRQCTTFAHPNFELRLKIESISKVDSAIWNIYVFDMTALGFRSKSSLQLMMMVLLNRKLFQNLVHLSL